MKSLRDQRMVKMPGRESQGQAKGRQRERKERKKGRERKKRGRTRKKITS